MAAINREVEVDVHRPINSKFTESEPVTVTTIQPSNSRRTHSFSHRGHSTPPSYNQKRFREMENMADMENDENPGPEDNSGIQTNDPPPLKRQGSSYTPYLEDKLQRKLKFFFMNPWEKFTARRKCPWKLFFQVMKIFLVTAQLIMFGYERSAFVEYVEKNNLALKHLYLKEWNTGYETMPYPPASGIYAIYTKEELYDHINFAMKNYNATNSLALGTFRFIHVNHTAIPMKLCDIHYVKGDIYDNETYTFDSKIDTTCVEIGPIEKRNRTTNETYEAFDIEELLKMKNSSINFNTLLKIELRFKLKSYRLGINHKRRKPECFNVDGKAVFDDANRDGQMKIDLVTTLQEIECHGEFSSEDEERSERIRETLFDAIVMFVSFISTVLCIRSIIRGLKLRKETVSFFKKRFRKKLSWSDQMEFLNLWYVCIVINDILTVIGSSFKIQLDNRNARSSSENYDFCGLMLGTGSLLVWLGVVRYIGFFKTFNILVLVLKKAFPNMMRFLVCTIMLYTGFMLCGWVVLGPYHIKFREISTSSECLYSLINGDDMFVTFSATVTKNPVIWYYSRIFLYLFISLFIYAVLNLFMAVIIDTYETIKEYYENGFPKSELFEFIDLCEDSPQSPIYRREDKTCSLFSCLCLCCKDHPDRPNERSSLLRT